MPQPLRFFTPARSLECCSRSTTPSCSTCWRITTLSRARSRKLSPFSRLIREKLLTRNKKTTYENLRGVLYLYILLFTFCFQRFSLTLQLCKIFIVSRKENYILSQNAGVF